MCGIFGFAKSQKVLSGLAVHQIQGMVLDLAVLNESRGKDGTGLALLSPSELSVFKEASPVSDLLGKKRFKSVVRRINSETLICLGHTRLATVGSVRNEHCHPFVSEDFVGVHNGHFLNREDLLKKYKKSAQTPVDSEAIFRVLDGEKRLTGVVSKLKEMSGDFALGFAHLENPFNLYLIRNEERPLHVAYVKPLETLFWSSERKHLEYGLVRNDLEAKVYELQEDHLYSADVRQFNGKSNMSKQPCRIEPPKWQTAVEEDFQPGEQGYLFHFEELEACGFLEGSGITERTKIRCGGCANEMPAGELYYDEVSRQFICERCSFDYPSFGDEQIQMEEK